MKKPLYYILNKYFLFLVLLLLAFGCSKDLPPEEKEQPTSSSEIAGGGLSKVYNFSLFTPQVISPDITGNVLLEVYFKRFPSHQLVLDTEWDILIPLYDDGTHGDKIASDNIHTAEISAEEILKLDTPNAYSKPTVGKIHLNVGYLTIFAEIWNENIPLMDLKALSPSVQQTDRLVNITSPTPSPSFREEHIQTFYKHFGDDYDFINIIYPGYNANRFHSTIRQNIQGIGMSLYDNSGEYGSPERLIGINVFPNTSYYDGASTGYQHEIGHQWINFLEGTVLESGIPHWPVSDLANSIMGYSPGGGQGLNFPYDLIQQDENTWLLESRSSPPVFNDLELYLMGLLPPGEVKPHIVFDDQQQSTFPGATLIGPVTTVTIDDITEAFGPRIPPVASEPKEFNIATIIVSHSLLSSKAMSYYDHYTQRAELTTETHVKIGYAVYSAKPFYMSVNGKATINTMLR